VLNATIPSLLLLAKTHYNLPTYLRYLPTYTYNVIHTWHKEEQAEPLGNAGKYREVNQSVRQVSHKTRWVGLPPTLPCSYRSSRQRSSGPTEWHDDDDDDNDGANRERADSELVLFTLCSLVGGCTRLVRHFTNAAYRQRCVLHHPHHSLLCSCHQCGGWGPSSRNDPSNRPVVLTHPSQVIP
jgi:hypothetical protein